jgi:hypothetical protein
MDSNAMTALDVAVNMQERGGTDAETGKKAESLMIRRGAKSAVRCQF